MPDATQPVKRHGPWRHPDEETTDLYPGLVVHDGRQSGSITVGRSRLPLWAFASVAVVHGWDEVEDGWEPSHYGYTSSDLASFVYELLNVRGEFGRLLLTLANAERLEGERCDAVLEPHGPVVNITPGDPDAVQLPPSWWEDDELKAPVVDQLRRCLAVLTEGDA